MQADLSDRNEQFMSGEGGGYNTPHQKGLGKAGPDRDIYRWQPTSGADGQDQKEAGGYS